MDENIPIARFANLQHVRPSNNSLQHNLFLPPKSLKLSVFNISELQSDQIWELGDMYVAPSRGTVIGRADLTGNQIAEKGLKIEEASPPPRHMDIIGWPEEKEKRLTIAKSLTLQSIFIKR